ncbi:MAG: SIS domain-containing protein [Oscillospiraceae bacterium]|nr:SIS domain-containing protein [Oscillospiraceae bacterium]
MAKVYDFFKLNKGETLTPQDLKDYEAETARLYKEFPETCEKLKEVLSKKYDAVYAIGIGDSLYSAGAVEMGSWSYLKNRLHVIESHEFNYYHLDYMPKNSLVIICSGGGQAARTVESCYLAQKRGATVIALTLVPQSRLASAANHVLVFQPDRKTYIDGACNFIALASMTHILTAKLALYAGDITAAQEQALYAKAQTFASRGFAACMNANEDAIKAAMQKAKDLGQRKFYFLGAGPNYILTELGGAKFMEQSAADGIHQQLEEYGHEQYWVHNRNNHADFIFLICPEGKCTSRCVENLREMDYLHLNTIVLTTKADPEIKKLATYVLETGEIEEDYFWLAAGNILTRCANFYTAYIGFTDGQFACEEQKAEHYRTIQFSRFCDEVKEHDIAIPDAGTLAANGPQGLNFLKK